LHQELVIDVPHPDIPELRTQGMAIKLGTTPGSIRRPPPKLGEHTETILNELGLGPAKITELRAQGAI